MKEKRLNSIEEFVQGHVFLRLLKYAAPYWWRFAICLLLVLGITVLEIYKPILTGNAIDIFSQSADFSQIPATLAAAMEGRQIQPILL